MSSILTFILQPYLFWRGHYRQYFMNLVSSQFNYIYCDTNEHSIPNSQYLKAANFDVEHSFFSFSLARLINSFKVVWEALEISRRHKNEAIIFHFIEFEPFSFLFFYLFNANKKVILIVTVHSIERSTFASKFKNWMSILQRFFYRMAINQCLKSNCVFVVHYEAHKRQLQEIINNKRLVVVNEYPSPLSKVPDRKYWSSQFNLLIYGQIREDKGIYEFLTNTEIQNLKITIAGKIHDERVHKLKSNPNYTFLDYFISDNELTEIMISHNFLILPYKHGYTGGAGPLKDAFAYAMPVICSDIEIFNEIVQNPCKGYIYKQESDIIKFLESVSPEEYEIMSNNCLSYANTFTWSRMRDRYFNLYSSLTNNPKML